MNGRVYDYNLGRFMSVDPFVHGGSQGLNPYSYIMNNPLSGTDPTGYSPEDLTDLDMSTVEDIQVTENGDMIVNTSNGSFKVESVNGANVSGSFGGLHDAGMAMMDAGGQEEAASKGNNFTILGKFDSNVQSGAYSAREDGWDEMLANEDKADAHTIASVDGAEGQNGEVYELQSMRMLAEGYGFEDKPSTQTIRTRRDVIDTALSRLMPDSNLHSAVPLFKEVARFGVGAGVASFIGDVTEVKTMTGFYGVDKWEYIYRVTNQSGEELPMQRFTRFHRNNTIFKVTDTKYDYKDVRWFPDWSVE